MGGDDMPVLNQKLPGVSGLNERKPVPEGDVIPEVSHPYPHRYLKSWVHEVVLAYDNPDYILTFREHFEIKHSLMDFEKKLEAIEARQKYKMDEGTRGIRQREEKAKKEKEEKKEKAVEKERLEFNTFDEAKEEAEYQARKAAKKAKEEAAAKAEVRACLCDILVRSFIMRSPHALLSYTGSLVHHALPSCTPLIHWFARSLCAPLMHSSHTLVRSFIMRSPHGHAAIYA
jgi:hypothetical protein